MRYIIFLFVALLAFLTLVEAQDRFKAKKYQVYLTSYLSKTRYEFRDGKKKTLYKVSHKLFRSYRWRVENKGKVLWNIDQHLVASTELKPTSNLAAAKGKPVTMKRQATLIIKEYDFDYQGGHYMWKYTPIYGMTLTDRDSKKELASFLKFSIFYYMGNLIVDKEFVKVADEKAGFDSLAVGTLIAACDQIKYI